MDSGSHCKVAGRAVDYEYTVAINMLPSQKSNATMKKCVPNIIVDLKEFSSIRT